MATKKKMLQAAAGNAGAGGAALDVDDVFSCHLYQGNGGSHTITNGIDLTEGGLVWFKNRDRAVDHTFVDSERGINKFLLSPDNSGEGTNDLVVTSFNTNGFSMNNGYTNCNYNGEDYASWTFLKSKRFFDIQTYSGTGSAGLTINHDLGSIPGCIMVRRLDAGDGFQVYHRGSHPTAPEDYKSDLSTTMSFSNDTMWNDFAPTDTQFQLGARDAGNKAGTNYVAYLFAHNDGDGEFGPDSDQDIIKCGSFTTDGSGFVPEVDLGFEPSWMLVKQTNAANSWYIIDALRDWSHNSTVYLRANLDNAEGTWTQPYFGSPTPTGFKGNLSSGVNNGTFIYIAIRRGPLAPPESATDVFATAFDAGATNPTYVSGFVADMGIQTNTTGYNKRVSSRLTSGRFLEADNTGAEGVQTSNYTWDFMDGWNNQTINSTWLSWMWKRAPSYFDVVAYEGSGVNGNSISHNLTSSPEMIWVKRRDSSADWFVYHTALTSNYYLNLNSASAETFGVRINTPTDTTFNVGSNSGVNAFGGDYIAYLFASLAGISKVGSYTGNGSSQNIDCGFSSGARFVLIKRTDSTGDWYVWDTERGIVAGNDPHLSLNSNAAEVTTDDSVDPVSSGFAVNQVSATNINVSSADYIFYAVS